MGCKSIKLKGKLMSNVKRVNILASVEWGWLQDDYDDDEEQRVAAFFGRIMTNPIYGLKVETFETSRRVSTKSGGTTMIVDVRIFGQVAISVVALGRVVDFMKKHGKIVTASYCDIEEKTEWLPIP